MKKNLLLITFLLLAAGLSAQSLVSGSIDVVNYSYESPQNAYLIEAEGNNFFRISGTYSDFTDHPLLSGITNDFQSLYFIKYNDEGMPLKSHVIYGTSYPEYAASFKGGLTVMARASNQIQTDGQIITPAGESQTEFLASYDADCNLMKLVEVWALTSNQWASSEAIMDPKDGSIYLYGGANQPLDLRNFGTLGKDVTTPNNYFYVIKYNGDLDLQWVYQSGYDPELSGTSPYMSSMRLFPGSNGSVLLSGVYGTETSPIINDTSLPPYMDGYGTFALMLDQVGNTLWAQDGLLKGYGYASKIFKGFPMEDGDFILVGNTNTGYYQLGEAIIEFPDSDQNNQFVLRIDRSGQLVWLRTFDSHGQVDEGKKKGTDSEDFSPSIFYDAISWNDRILYMTAPFRNSAFSVNGKTLALDYSNGIYVAAMNMEDGTELWGYGLSSDNISIFGFDADRSGNISLMGSNSYTQSMEGLDAAAPVAGDFIFLLGLDFNGNPLWYNNISLASAPYYNLNGTDLEVLPNGGTFASMKLNAINTVNIGGTDLPTALTSYSSWLVGLKPEMELGGTVKDESGNPIYPGYVRAVKRAPWGTHPIVDSVLIQDDGSYQFTALYPGFYTLQALPDPVQYPDVIPTYYGNNVGWKSASYSDIPVDFKANILNIVVVQVAKLTPADGSGSMSGTIVYEEDDEGGKKSTMARPVKKSGVILLGAAKKSTMAGEVVAYGETDDFGMFTFGNVPDGVYLLMVDIPGLEMLETHEVTIEGNSIKSGLDYTVSEEGIYTYSGVGISFVEDEILKVWPNPGQGMILMDLPASGDYSVRVFATDGRLVLKREINSAGGATALNISAYQDGVYLIKIDGPDTSAVIKYMKK